MAFKPIQLPSGRWLIRWHDAYGRRRCATYEREGQAAAALARKRVERDDVLSGRARPLSDKALREVAEDWLRARPPKRKRDDRSHLDHHILPYLGHLRMPEVGPRL